MIKTLSLCIGLILAVQSTSAQTLTWAKQIGADAQDGKTGHGFVHLVR
jgi:hypothetical protein